MTAEEAKFYPLTDSEPESIEPGELPSSYGRSRLVLLPVDPYRLYAYWELSGDPPPTAGARAVLRLHESSASGGARPFDVDIDLAAGNSYIHLWSAEKSYTADLGLRQEDGGFVALARSNTITSPASAPVPAAAPVQHPPRQPVPDVPSATKPQPSVSPVSPAASQAKPQASAVAEGETPATPVPVTPIPATSHAPLRIPDVPRHIVAHLAEVFNRESEFNLPVAQRIEELPPAPHLTAELDPEIEPEWISAAEPDLESAFEESTIFGDLPFQPATPEPLDLTQYSQERFIPGLSSEAGPLAS